MSHVTGKWLGVQKAPGDAKEIADGQGVVAVHAVLLHTGKVLLWNSRYEGLELLYAAWTWDPKTNTGSEDLPFNGIDSTGPWSRGSDIDIFCAHHVVLEDGRVMVLGGASGGQAEGTSEGADGVWIFDPEAGNDGEWQKIGDMAGGRWYPTPVLMDDGSVVVFSGWESATIQGGETGRRIIARHERLAPPEYQPIPITGGERALFLFPGMHLVRGGKVFHIQTAWAYTPPLADLVPTSSFQLDDGGNGQWLVYQEEPGRPIFPVVPYRQEGMSVLLPPANEGKILVVGGGYVVDNEQHPNAEPDSWEILDTQLELPTWTHKGKLRHKRINVNALILPNSFVLIVGGHDNFRGNHTEAGRAMTAELFDPKAAMDDPENYMSVETEPMGASRMYHSTLVLLPDGSVMAAGGFDMHLGEPPQQAARNNHRNFEIYQPPYFFMGPRSTIQTLSDDVIDYGEPFTVGYEQPGKGISAVVLMRPNCMTHHTDSGQRLIDLEFENTAKNTALITMPLDATIAPPGYYMLFLIDEDGVPCEEAKFVRLARVSG